MNNQQRRALQQLERANGELRPADLVAAARSDPNHPWHDRFPDVQEAAQQRWLDIAATIISEYKIEITIARRSVQINGYRKNPIRVVGVRSYKSTNSIKAQREESRAALLGRVTTMIGWAQNFINDSKYWEFAEVATMVETALAELLQAQAWLATPPPPPRRRGRGSRRGGRPSGPSAPPPT